MSIGLHTQEVTDTEKLRMFNYFQSFGWLQFSEVESIEVPKEPIDRAAGEKSRSQILRNVLYRLWEQSDKRDLMTSDEYYRTHMDILIDQLKERLQ